MADGYLEQHQLDYEAHKAAWLRKKKHLSRQKTGAINRPEDEAL